MHTGHLLSWDQDVCVCGGRDSVYVAQAALKHAGSLDIY